MLDRRPRQLSAAEGQLLTDLASVAQDLLHLQAAQAADATLVPKLRARLDGPLQQSFTRLSTLAELNQWAGPADTEEASRYTESRLDEARYLAQTLHWELQAALHQVQKEMVTRPVA
ncbi:MAG TPA: hypothetical protein VF629_22470 [Hymenobacter sp.]|uniref:hypothetical protein n=1 Tax=Hymenobacter sp. TaxID=1898978 RepID=UPI002EDB9927